MSFPLSTSTRSTSAWESLADFVLFFAELKNCLMLPLFDGLDGDLFVNILSCLFDIFLEAVLIFAAVRKCRPQVFQAMHDLPYNVI